MMLPSAEPQEVVVQRAIISFIVAALVLAGRPAAAQPPFRIEFGAGLAVPTGSAAVRDGWNPGFTLSAGVLVPVGSRLAVTLDAGYSRFGFDSTGYELAIVDQFPNVNVAGNDLYVLPLTVGAEFLLTSWGNTRPYAHADLGWTHTGVSTPSASGPNASGLQFHDPLNDAFGIGIGFGVRTVLTPNTYLFADAMWRIAWTNPDPLSFVPIRLGVRF
jgi:hypothetical protein